MIQALNIDGHQIVAKRLNPGTTLGNPIILLHGIGGSVNFWSDDQTQIFQEQGPCYAMSLPGHYPAAFPSGFCKEQITATLIAKLTAKAIHELVGNVPVTLAGMSTGGFTALALAAQAPQIGQSCNFYFWLSSWEMVRMAGLFPKTCPWRSNWSSPVQVYLSKTKPDEEWIQPPMVCLCR